AEPFEAGGAVGTHAVEHRLAAAERQFGHRVLVSHAARQPQHIGERILRPLVGPDAAAARGGPERGGVNGDEAGEAQLLVADLDDVLVAVIGWVIFPIDHWIGSSSRSWRAKRPGGEPNERTLS